MKQIILLLMFLLNIATSAQTVGKKLENKANETVDKVIDKIDIDTILSRKKKKSKKVPEKIAPGGSEESNTEQPTVARERIAQKPESQGTASVAEKSGKYIMYYQDVMMGDQSNTKFGPFFVPSTGECVDVESAGEIQKDVAMVLFRGYGGSLILTFPGNAKEADLSISYDEIEMFKESNGGMGSWEQENINSGQLYKGSMSGDAFEKLVQANSWKSFNTAYANNMDGMYGEYSSPVAGVYSIKFSNSLRAPLMRIKNVIPKSAKGGSIKFDIIVECKK
ncbi:hypothetical protein [Niabella hirudinis]|uniref:hypothetical protein n=1 Tax=Niabella hirudinis TaxID=1285929 RepID=UPI003EB9E5C0